MSLRCRKRSCVVAGVRSDRYTAGMARQDPLDDDLTIHRTGDFLAEQGIADPAEFRVKSHLCNEIARISERRGLTSVGLAEFAGETQQDVERIVAVHARAESVELPLTLADRPELVASRDDYIT